MQAFEELQGRLGEVLAANQAGSGVDHVLIALPSFSVGESLLSHYVERIPGLEHRYLLAILMLHRIESCEFAFISCSAPDSDVVEYYLSLLPADKRNSARRRLRIVEIPDRTGRAVAAKLLDRPDLMDELCSWVRGRPAVIEPWNVQADEVALAEHLEVPINGTSPALWPLGFKSAGRRLFAEAGVPSAAGRDGVRSVDEIADVVAAIRTAHPAAAGVVVKLDDSGAGDGNIVIDLREHDALRRALDALPDWYVTDLAAGGVVEEMISGSPLTSPSVQVDMLPDAPVRVLATHEQVLGGVTGQVYMGCRFPADAESAPQLATYGRAIGELLAERGARGRAGVDFVAARSKRAGSCTRWRSTFERAARHIPTRCSATSFPVSTTPTGEWIVAKDGSTRAYWSTDNLVDASWLGLAPRAVMDAVAAAGLQFDIDRGTRVVIHMLSGLAIDGRLGPSIGHDAVHAGELYEAAAAAIAQAAASP